MAKVRWKIGDHVFLKNNSRRIGEIVDVDENWYEFDTDKTMVAYQVHWAPGDSSFEPQKDLAKVR